MLYPTLIPLGLLYQVWRSKVSESKEPDSDTLRLGGKVSESEKR